MKHILVPVDGSNAACDAAIFAAELCREAKASLTLLYVYDAPGVTALGLRYLTPEDFKRAEREVAKDILERSREAIGNTSIPIETKVSYGHPGNEIVGYGKSHSVDLIVMGRRGTSALKRVLLGGVSNFVIQHAPCPVTVVH